MEANDGKNWQMVKWAAINGIFLWMLWAGLVEDVTGALNVGLFGVWFLGVTSFLYLTPSVLAKMAGDKRFPSVPPWIDVSFDLIVLLLLLWHGRWFSGSAYALHMILMSAVRELVKQRREAKQTTSSENRRVTRGDPLLTRFNELATYNSELRRGIVHSPEHRQRMERLQAEHDAEFERRFMKGIEL